MTGNLGHFYVIYVLSHQEVRMTYGSGRWRDTSQGGSPQFDSFFFGIGRNCRIRCGYQMTNAKNFIDLSGPINLDLTKTNRDGVRCSQQQKKSLGELPTNSALDDHSG